MPPGIFKRFHPVGIWAPVPKVPATVPVSVLYRQVFVAAGSTSSTGFPLDQSTRGSFTAATCITPFWSIYVPVLARLNCASH